MKRIISSFCRSKVKFVKTVEEAISPVKTGDIILMGGFGNCGVPNALVVGLTEKSEEVKDLTVASNAAGVPTYGPALLAEYGMLKKLIVSYIGGADNVIDMYWNGGIEVEFTPQGSLNEKMRAAGAGIPAFYTPTGVGTVVETGGFTLKYDPETLEPEVLSEEKPTREFNGKKYLLEESLYGDIAFVQGWKADTSGNVICRGAALNSNPDCAKGAKITIVEVEEIVEAGEIDPSRIDIPSIYVDYIVVPEPYEKEIEFLTYREENESDEGEEIKVTKEDMKDANVREKIARRVALEYEDGMYANVGIGIPTLSSNYLPEGVDITLQSENGILGLGPYPLKEEADADYTNASKQTITLLDGSSLVSSSESFAMIRGKHVQMSCLGGLQVSEKGDLSNWVIPGKFLTGMGGGMDLVSSGAKVVICMEHTSKNGDAKILVENTLPYSGVGVVNRIITDIAVIDVEDDHLVLKEKAWWVTVDEIKEKTEAPFIVADDLKDIEYSL